MTIHVLKCWPEFFQAIVDGRKRFEVRKNDRGYREGDRLHLREWDPTTGTYTGEEAHVVVTYLLDSSQYVVPGFVIMSLCRWEHPSGEYEMEPTT